MLATLLKILPVLWPFFKEMVMGGNRDPDSGARNTRLKGLFYAISLLLILLGYVGYYSFQTLQELHAMRTENVKLTTALESGESTQKTVQGELTQARTDNVQWLTRLREVRDQQLELQKQNGDLREQLANEKAKAAQLQYLLEAATNAGKNLGKFNVAPDSPRSLRKHNESVDVLHQLRQEAQDVENK